MEKSWFGFSKRLKCPWFGKGLIKSLPKYLVRIWSNPYQTMVIWAVSKIQAKISPWKITFFYPGFFVAIVWYESLKSDAYRGWGTYPEKTAVYSFYRPPPHAGSQITILIYFPRKFQKHFQKTFFIFLKWNFTTIKNVRFFGTKYSRLQQNCPPP